MPYAGSTVRAQVSHNCLRDCRLVVSDISAATLYVVMQHHSKLELPRTPRGKLSGRLVTILFVPPRLSAITFADEDRTVSGPTKNWIGFAGTLQASPPYHTAGVGLS